MRTNRSPLFDAATRRGKPTLACALVLALSSANACDAARFGDSSTTTEPASAFPEESVSPQGATRTDASNLKSERQVDDGTPAAVATSEAVAEVNDVPVNAVYADSDGDGFGAGPAQPGPTGIAAAPAGFVARDGDCAPDDPARFPGAAELLDDGVDGNCDGVDGWDCRSGTNPCGCQETPGKIERAADCATVDLFFVQVVACPFECGGVEPHAVVVGNRGGSRADAVELSVVVGVGAATSINLGELAAGESSSPILLPATEGRVTLALTSASDECAESDNATDLEVRRVDCR